MWDSFCSLENQQKASSLQGQTQQVQRIWTAGGLSSQLGDLVLVRGGDGEWSSRLFSSGKEKSKELHGERGAIPRTEAIFPSSQSCERGKVIQTPFLQLESPPVHSEHLF